MNANEIDNNAQRLYFSYPGSYFASKNTFKKELCGTTLIGRLIFIIVDFFKRGAETKKVHDLALKTLQNMQTQMDQEWPRWHCNGDERFGMYFGAPVDGVTYADVAKRILKQPLGKSEEIKNEANAVIKKFEELAFFNRFPELTKEHLIKQATIMQPRATQPSVSEMAIQQLIEGKRRNPTFEDIFPDNGL